MKKAALSSNSVSIHWRKKPVVALIEELEPPLNGALANLLATTTRVRNVRLCADVASSLSDIASQCQLSWAAKSKLTVEHKRRNIASQGVITHHADGQQHLTTPTRSPKLIAKKCDHALQWSPDSLFTRCFYGA